ncbi:Structural maintenance of chromosomes protein like [Actinidia chinensis var. chinensis]|uniref:Structural maintenance of chromosomes protein like n=1 Tax=Actinidia chinensis var. chinensis TaxID=1590841 RepID=A0A2R6QPS3_ACTCC|nr:Structural maintenance of chromosomes protein like [Actinidia chinensis var. chinensis]
MATTSDVTEHGGVHERDTLPPISKGKRGKSTDIMTSLEARLQRVEFAMADNRDKVEDMDQRIDGLEGGNEEFHREMQGILNSLADSWKAQMDALKDSLQVEIAAMKEEIKEVKGDWSLCKMAGPGAFESAKGWHADLAKAAKRMKKWAGKNRQAKPPNSKPKDSRDNPLFSIFRRERCLRPHGSRRSRSKPVT